MKRLIHSIIILTLVLLTACSDDDAVVMPPDTPTTGNATCNTISTLRTGEEAIEAAQRSLSLLDRHSPKSRGNESSRRIAADCHPLVVCSGSARSRNADSDTLMYVVNFDDNQGFALIAANRAVPELIAVTEQGSYDPAHPGDNTPFNYYIDNTLQILSSIPSVGDITLPNPPLTPVPQPEFRQEKDTVWFADVAPKITYNWGQSRDEGTYCSNGMAGCSNVAAAMVMAYFEHPSQLTLTYDDYSVISLNWEIMKYHYADGTSKFFCSCTDQTHSQLGHLCRELGHRSKSQYNKYELPDNNNNIVTVRETSTGTRDCQVTLQGLGYSVSHHLVSNPRNISVALTQGNTLLMVRGSASNDPGFAGHMWVCDGAISYDVNTTGYIWNRESIYEIIPKWEVYTTLKESFTYNHFNWGYYGDQNGYFVDYQTRIDGIEVNLQNFVQYLKVQL